MEKADTKRPWNIRAVQLDLARQRESVQTITDCIDFLGRYDFNTLVLYLEGAVRTKHFPHREPARSYTPQEMREVVAAAQRAGMDVIPVIATLGHAEHFLSCPELQHLNADGGYLCSHCFDPYQKETYQFLENYLTDICEIFPGPNLHVGLDESWPPPSLFLKKKSTFGKLFIDHTLRLYEICQRLSRRMWMWEDMFEYLSDEEIRRIPRDVMLCLWNYEPEAIDLGGITGHFNGKLRRHWLPLYEKEGFDVLICPCARELDATVRLTEFGRRHPRIAGGLQTLWILDQKFLPAMLPGIALAGTLWRDPSTDEQTARKQITQDLFPHADATDIQAIEVAMTQPLWPPCNGSIQPFLHGPMPLQELRWSRSVELAAGVIRHYWQRLADSQEKSIAGELWGGLQWQHISGQLRRLVPRVVDPRRGDERGAALQSALSDVLRQIAELTDYRRTQWAAQRGEIEPDRASPPLIELQRQLQPLLTRAAQPVTEDEALLEMRLFLYEGYAAPRLCVETRHGTQWITRLEGTFKSLDLMVSHYTIQMPMRMESRPEAMRISVSQYGGQGVVYAAIHQTRHGWVPQAVHATAGRVIDPEAILQNDETPAWLGSRRIVETYLQGRSDETSVVEITLRKINHSWES